MRSYTSCALCIALVGCAPKPQPISTQLHFKGHEVEVEAGFPGRPDNKMVFLIACGENRTGEVHHERVFFLPLSRKKCRSGTGPTSFKLHYSEGSSQIDYPFVADVPAEELYLRVEPVDGDKRERADSTFDVTLGSAGFSSNSTFSGLALAVDAPDDATVEVEGWQASAQETARDSRDRKLRRVIVNLTPKLDALTLQQLLHAPLSSKVKLELSARVSRAGSEPLVAVISVDVPAIELRMATEKRLIEGGHSHPAPNATPRGVFLEISQAHLFGPDGKLAEVTHVGSAHYGSEHSLGTCRYREGTFPHVGKDVVADATDLRTGKTISKTFPVGHDPCPGSYLMFTAAGAPGRVLTAASSRAAIAWFQSFVKAREATVQK